MYSCFFGFTVFPSCAIGWAVLFYFFSLLFLCCRSRLLGYIYTECCGRCVIMCSSLFYFIYLYLIFIFGSMVIKNVDCCYSWYIDIWSFLKVILYTHPQMYLIRIWLWLYFTVFTIVQGIAVCKYSWLLRCLQYCSKLWGISVLESLLRDHVTLKTLYHRNKYHFKIIMENRYFKL